MKELFEILSKPFKETDLEFYTKNFGHYSKKFAYVKVPEVLRRWHEAIEGRGVFQFRILTSMTDRVRGNDIVIDCELSFTPTMIIPREDGKPSYVAGVPVVVQQCGGSRINRAEEDIVTKINGKNKLLVKAGDPIDLGFDIKAAISDGFKKCSSMFGLGLYIYDGEEKEVVSKSETGTRSEIGTNGSTGNGYASATPTILPKIPDAQNEGVPSNKIQQEAIKNLMQSRNKLSFLKDRNKELESLTYNEAKAFIREIQQ